MTGLAHSDYSAALQCPLQILFSLNVAKRKKLLQDVCVYCHQVHEESGMLVVCACVQSLVQDSGSQRLLHDITEVCFRLCS